MTVAEGEEELSGRVDVEPAESDAAGPAATTVEWAVPDGEQPAARCPYCDRPFRRERLARLHVGVRHATACTDEEAAAYDAAHEEETDDLFVYHLKVVAGLVVLFFGTTYTYAFLLA